MIITKEQQEAWLSKYIKEGHTLDECVGFIDGIEIAMSAISEKINKCLLCLRPQDQELIETVNKLIIKLQTQTA